MPSELKTRNSELGTHHSVPCAIPSSLWTPSPLHPPTPGNKPFPIKIWGWLIWIEMTSTTL
jgi:hypothetical protein